LLALGVLVACGGSASPDSDLDGDGYALPDDCDDGDPDVNPGATEVWYDGVDQDCSGTSDHDADGDGHAATESGGGDCDDSDDGVHPLAEESCGNGRDDDCDTEVDENCGGNDTGGAWAGLVLSDADATFLGEAEDDYLGVSVGRADTDGDGRAELLMGAFYADPGGDHAGASYLWMDLLAPGPASYTVGASHARLLGVEGDVSGTDVAGAGDLDGDGLEDVVVGAMGLGGTIYVVHAPLVGDVDLDGQAARFHPGVDEDLGRTVAGGADLDGDGLPDVVAGAPDARDQAGAVYVIAGPASTSSPLADSAAVLFGPRGSGWRVGYDVDVGGDADGDGLADLVVGAEDGGTNGHGAAIWVPGPVVGDVRIGEVGIVLSGGEAADRAGDAVAWVGDVDQDGLDDFVVGDPNYSDVYGKRGTAWLVTGSSLSEGELSGATARFVSPETGGNLGTCADGGGDIDGDGRLEILLCDDDDSAIADKGGVVYVLTGPFTGAIELSTAAGRISGEGRYDRAGSSVIGGLDLDGDGLSDPVLGTIGVARTGSYAGAVSVFLGDAGL